MTVDTIMFVSQLQSKLNYVVLKRKGSNFYEKQINVHFNN